MRVSAIILGLIIATGAVMWVAHGLAPFEPPVDAGRG